MLEFFERLQQDSQVYVIGLLTAILVVNVVDTGFGWVNAKFNKNVVFQSSIALYGIIKKMMYFIVLVLFMFIAYLLLPATIALPALITLYIAYLLSEVNSVLSHLNLTEDGKKGELFITFMSRLLKGGN